MRSISSFTAVALSSLALAACGSGGSSSGSRDFVRVVGSSTVYPFSTAVAESAAKSAGIKSPVIESTGTGAGMKLFCAGIGAQHPDVENASRRMKLSEFEECTKNGVKDIIEIQIGIDGLAFAAGRDAPAMTLTPAEIYKALAANPFGKRNTAKNWSDINPALPAMPILVYGPPTTSGTRDSLAELILEKGCDTDPAMKALKTSDKDAHKKVCTEVRSDGPYVDSGENDNLIVQKLAQNPKAIGAFGYSFLEENLKTLKGVPLSGIAPTYETISDFSYPGARAMYIYVKPAHLSAIKGLAEYMAEWPKVWGADGLLKSKGMIVSPENVRARYADVVTNKTLMNSADLK
ncbi:substrate-binding domain-containing protein [Novosphingobium sp.]|uniref:substrate-binding domain-containing protein n=1 Tax=Novosphingobium sp. TaxID=1874826 RepID=UPI0027356C94|nr:substrate-binding domain-containing protein [Novosphingobium sp.]MDP3906563.1 substrate-binding domain-containing protein [Novosphingobium sp.]